MRSGIGYDSDEGREYAAAITSVMATGLPHVGRASRARRPV